MNPHIWSVLSGAAGYGAIAYALQTFPVPQNPYGRWALGVLNYIFANREKAAAHFAD